MGLPVQEFSLAPNSMPMTMYSSLVGNSAITNSGHKERNGGHIDSEVNRSLRISSEQKGDATCASRTVENQAT